METNTSDIPELELALLRRGLDGRHGVGERCDGCQRSLLIGERAYAYEDGRLRCSLCRQQIAEQAIDFHIVHGPAFGNSIRVLDQRPLRHAA